jgi:pyruvate dehydrogenase (quinone)
MGRRVSGRSSWVLEALVDPNAPPMPPHMSFEQASNLAKSGLAGDANALGFLKQIWKEMTSERNGRS